MLAWPNSHCLRKLCKTLFCLKIGTITSAYHVTKACRMKQYIHNFIWTFVISENIQLLLQMSHQNTPDSPVQRQQSVSECVRVCVCVCVCVCTVLHLMLERLNVPPPPHCSVNTAHPNTVKLISSHHRGSFWLSDKSILSLIINCDTHNHWTTAALNKWHVFCVIILCILTNMTH